MRKLVRIETIKDLQPIPGADKIEVATVQSWKIVVQKEEFKIGDMVIYYEIDSFLPEKSEYEFLRKSCFKKMADGSEGFRLKTIKLRNQISQGLVMPINILKTSLPHGWVFADKKLVIKNLDDGRQFSVQPGVELTELLQVKKYEAPIPAELAGKVKGVFPSFVSRTDEERIQNFTEQYPDLMQHEYYATEKLDGASATFYLKDGEFGCCSRGLDLLEDNKNSFWKFARANDLENKLKSLNKNTAVQGELIGEGVQGNPYKISGQTVKFFNVFDIDTYSYVPFEEFVAMINSLGLETVPVLDENFKLPSTIDELLLIADGKSKLLDTANREVIVTY